MTKYKTNDKKKARRYILFSKDLTSNPNFSQPDTVNFINYNSLNHES